MNSRLAKIFAVLSLVGVGMKAPAQNKIGEAKNFLSASVDYTHFFREAVQAQKPVAAHAEFMRTFKAVPLYGALKVSMPIAGDEPPPQDRPDNSAGVAQFWGKVSMGAYVPFVFKNESYLLLRGSADYNVINTDQKTFGAGGATFTPSYHRGPFSVYTSFRTQFKNAGSDTTVVPVATGNIIHTGKPMFSGAVGITYTMK
jgi:hypothetical protein